GESGGAAAARGGRVAIRVARGLEEMVARAWGGASLRVDAGARLGLVMTYGEPRRALADALMREDEPHLWVAAYPRRVRLGPFVEPGRSACLRCVDAHLGERDARRATVLHQLDELPRAPDLVPDPSLV